MSFLTHQPPSLVVIACDPPPPRLPVPHPEYLPLAPVEIGLTAPAQGANDGRGPLNVHDHVLNADWRKKNNYLY